MASAAEIRQGLIERGLAPHVADGFLMNFQHESGLVPDITERVPNVHGTRGRGLYQLTGPRRDAYEARYGDAYDVDSQLDFLMYELGGPEARAAERINAATTPGDAAAAIVTHFLRPAAQHRDRRVAEYTGGSVPDFAGLMAPGAGRGAGLGFSGAAAGSPDRPDPGLAATFGFDTAALGAPPIGLPSLFGGGQRMMADAPSRQEREADETQRRRQALFGAGGLADVYGESAPNSAQNRVSQQRLFG